jgi:hypothetical protein
VLGVLGERGVRALDGLLEAGERAGGGLGGGDELRRVHREVTLAVASGTRAPTTKASVRYTAIQDRIGTTLARNEALVTRAPGGARPIAAYGGDDHDRTAPLAPRP